MVVYLMQNKNIFPPPDESLNVDEMSFSQVVRHWMDTFMHRSMRGWHHFVKSTGLSLPQLSILMQIQHRGTCSLSELSTGFDITPAAVSQLVDKLVQAGLLIRTVDSNDRRVKVLDISPEGRALIEQGTAERCRWMERLGDALSDEEKHAVKVGLLLLARAAEALDDRFPNEETDAD